MKPFTWTNLDLRPVLKQIDVRIEFGSENRPNPTNFWLVEHPKWRSLPLACQWYLNVWVANGTGDLLMFPWPNDTQCCQTWRIWSYAFLLFFIGKIEVMYLQVDTSCYLSLLISECSPLRRCLQATSLHVHLQPLSQKGWGAHDSPMKLCQEVGSHILWGSQKINHKYSEKCRSLSWLAIPHGNIKGCSHINPLVLSHEPTAG